MSADNSSPPPDRYARQVRYPPLGEQGQRRLSESRALVCGCGALGSAIADMLVRAGVGAVRIVDRDFVELGNLHRQSLFDEADAAAALPKAVAAAEKLRRINSAVQVQPIVADIEPANIEGFCQLCGVMLDGTDNFETRFLMNDAAVRLGLPWVYGGCVGAEGQTMTILPGHTGCLRCLLPECPPPGSTPTCDTAGILSPIVHMIAALEVAEAVKILSGNSQAVSRHLTFVDVWQNRFSRLDVAALRSARLPGLSAARVRLAFGPGGQQHGRALRPKCGATKPSRPGRAAERPGPAAGRPGPYHPQSLPSAAGGRGPPDHALPRRPGHYPRHPRSGRRPHHLRQIRGLLKPSRAVVRRLSCS